MVVPLLGGHRGEIVWRSNWQPTSAAPPRSLRRAILPMDFSRFDDLPEGWRFADPKMAKSVMAAANTMILPSIIPQHGYLFQKILGLSNA